ncbi:MAG: gamma-glutamylcyclotransferase family protein [Pseudomonadota bacterium]
MRLPLVSSGDAFIFYGLLKQHAAGAPSHINLEEAGRFEAPCQFRGDMYDLGGYPGVVAGDTLCQGVVWRIEDVSILPELDAFEDVVPGNPEASRYWRETWSILDQAGHATGEMAQIYVYYAALEDCPRIANGHWPVSMGRSRIVGDV